MRSKNECSVCGETFWCGDCGEAHTRVLVEDDRESDTYGLKKRRYLLCDSCTSKLECFLAEEKLRKRGVEF